MVSALTGAYSTGFEVNDERYKTSVELVPGTVELYTYFKLYTNHVVIINMSFTDELAAENIKSATHIFMNNLKYDPKDVNGLLDHMYKEVKDKFNNNINNLKLTNLLNFLQKKRSSLQLPLWNVLQQKK